MFDTFYEEKPVNNQPRPGQIQEQKLTLHPSRLKMLLALVGSLACVVIGIWMVMSGDLWQMGLGIISISFFGLGVPIFLIGLVRPFPVLKINAEGIRQQSFFGSIFVAWEEVDTILATRGRTASLTVYLSETGKETFSVRHPRRWRISRLFGDLPPITLSPLLLPFPPQQVSEMLQMNYQQQIEEYHITLR